MEENPRKPPKRQENKTIISDNLHHNDLWGIIEALIFLRNESQKMNQPLVAESINACFSLCKLALTITLSASCDDKKNS